MEENKKQKIIAAGVDLDSAMERFMGNEALLMRFLGKFSQDPNFGMLKEAMEGRRYEDAFKAAHTLKGLCGNLSLKNLFNVVDKEVEFLRCGNHKEAEEVFPEVVAEYEKTVSLLDTI